MSHKLLLTSAAIVGAICLSTITSAVADTIYDMDLAVGVSSSVTGFIETNCNSCILVSTNNISPNITNFSLSLNIDGNPPVVLTPSNSDGFNVLGPDLTATPTGIFFNFGALDGATVFSIGQSGAAATSEFCLSANINSCNVPTPLIFISTGPGVFSEAFPGANTVEIASVASTSTTPLPAALPLFATGIGGLGLLGWRRKRKAQAVA
jgi:hypothetical protein